MEPSFDELVHRIETLKREKRRWKLAAIGALVSASALLLCGGAGSFGVFYLQVRQLRLLALDAEMARLEAERARQGGRQRPPPGRGRAAPPRSG